MKRVTAAFAAALLCASGAVAVSEPGPNQAVIDGADMPAKLSAFGIFRAGTSEPVDALLPYTLHTPLFSDYAEKHRLIWVPPGQQARVAEDGHIDFPVGSLIVKSFGWPEQNGGRPARGKPVGKKATSTAAKKAPAKKAASPKAAKRG